MYVRSQSPNDLNELIITAMKSFNIAVKSQVTAPKVSLIDGEVQPKKALVIYAHVNMTTNLRLFVQRVNVLFVVNILQNQWFTRITLMICNFHFDKKTYKYCIHHCNIFFSLTQPKSLSPLLPSKKKSKKEKEKGPIFLVLDNRDQYGNNQNDSFLPKILLVLQK